MPEIRIMTQPNLQYSKDTQVILTMFNPLDTLTHVYLLPDDREDAEWTNSKVPRLFLTIKINKAHLVDTPQVYVKASL